ncbi:hypothetical protein GLOIN_2v1474922 [Rhizophagus clarus]|uniref:Uncharacterized protein n=1 Tax=Rhizophagus clarus TaxID=94130 RepID=A0A8H3LET1_9GLOM|nr:hypothetical protein GLOIN_2v1474922 [Rhizophagus clarus]GES84527.1 hypothetical protein GLOIN_2v1474922 [Rhizophagus clarus]
MNIKYSYGYFDKLGEPDEQFISDFKKDLKILYGEEDTAMIDDIKNIDLLMKYIKGKMQVDLKEIITENESQQFKFIFPEIYNESTIK